ncbi:hypothetical protein [Ktedonobacter robiniae]|uniref:hypothetical protein n=1 Tax=Ktedonobacter robiniae TaxID=2778365 RepID=UPI001F46AF97|nr:hypothetical protein [Ktedonobacter robiniae]
MERLDQPLFQHLIRPDLTFGQPEQVAGVVAALVLDDGGFITGEIAKVDGSP